MGTGYSILLHTHELLITLYVLIFTIKVVLLLINNESALANFRKKTRIVGEMVLPSLFLISGIILAVMSKTGFGDNWFLIKMCLIALSVGTGIFTFNKNSKILGILTFLIFIYVIMLSYIKDPMLKKPARPLAENVITDPHAAGYDAVKHGLAVYINSGCYTCHGTDGKLGNHGAANLSISVLPDADIINVIRNGRGSIMKGYGEKLNPIEIHALTEYVKSLRIHN